MNARPTPSEDRLARLSLRLPTSLRSELARRAAEEGVSLNQLIVALLAGSIGFSLEG